MPDSLPGDRSPWLQNFIGLLLFLLYSATGHSQVSGYTFSQSTETFTAVAGANSTATGDDGTQNAINIGFNFVFGSTTYTTFSISTNGFIRLGADISTGVPHYTNGLSTSTTNAPLIAPIWDDNHRNTGTISYLSDGVAPNRKLEISWSGVNVGGGGSTSATNLANYKIRLTETTNVIEIIYGTMASAGAVTASIGLNDATSFLSVTPTSTATASNSTANNGISDLSNLAGKKYVFTPPPPCEVPTSLSASASANAAGASAISGSFTAASSAPSGYMVVRTTANVAPAPANGTTYTVGSNAIGYIEYFGSSAGNWNSTGLAPNTQYYYWVFSYNNTACSGIKYSASSTTATATTTAWYSMTPGTETFTYLTGSTYPTLSEADDATATNIPIGFPFVYNGNAYATVGISTNGMMALGTLSDYFSTNSLAGTSSRPYIAPLWDDLEVAGTANSISYQTSGTAPNRVFTVEWKNVKWNYQASGPVVSFQVKLYEGSNTVKFLYKDEGGTYNAGSSAGASAGIAGSTASAPFLSLSSLGASPTASGLTETNSIGVKPATDQTYTFAPPSPATLPAPTNLTAGTITTNSIQLNWTASSPSTGVTGYIVMRSNDGGATYTVNDGTTAAGVTTLTVSSLSVSTTYYWRVYAYGGEGNISLPLSNSFATANGTIYYWTGNATAAWNNAATWNTSADNTGSQRTTPNVNDVLIVDGAGTTAGTAITGATINTSETIGKLVVSNNTAFTLSSNNTTVRTITIGGGPNTDFDIQAGSSMVLSGNPVAIAFSGTGTTGSIAGTLTISGTTANSLITTGGTGTSVTVTGTVNFGSSSTSPVITGSTATLNFASGSFYNHTFTTQAGTIPTATWNAASTVVISGYTSGNIPGNLTQTFGNFTWNTPNLGGAANLAGGSINAAGTFTMASTGTAQLRTNNNQSTAVISAVNYVQTGGTLNLSNGTGVGTLRISGAFTQSGGSITESDTGSGWIEFNGTSAQNVTLGTISNTINFRVNNNSGINLTGTMPINAGAILRISSTANPAINGGTLTYSGATTLTYDATGNQTVTSKEWPSANGPASLVVNNTGTAGSANRVTLHESRTLSGNLTMTSGVLVLGNNDLSVSGTVSGTASNTNFIATNGTGQFIQTFAATGLRVFPVGDITGTDEASPVEVNMGTFNGTANSVVGVRVTDAKLTADLSPDNYLTRYYSFTESGTRTDAQYSLKLTYPAGDIVGLNSLTKLYRYNGTTPNVFPAATPGTTEVTASGLFLSSTPLANQDFTLSAAPVQTYTWKGGGFADYTLAANWSPARNTPDATDILEFDGANIDALNTAGPVIALNLPSSQTIGRLLLKNNATVTLQAAAGSSALTINGGVGDDLDIPSGSSLTVAGSSTMTFRYGGSTTANIAGSFTLGSTSADITYNGTGAVTTVNGSFTNANAAGTGMTVSAANFLVNGHYRHNGNGGTIPAGTYANTSTLHINGLTSSNIGTFTPTSIGNLVINSNVGAGNNVHLAAGGVTINGNLTVSGTGSGSVALGSSPNNTVNGIITIDGGVFRLGTSTSTGGTLTALGGFIQNGGTVTTSTTSTFATNTINVGNASTASNFTQTDGTLTSATPATAGLTLNLFGNFAQSGGTITESSSGTLSIVFQKTTAGAQTIDIEGVISEAVSITHNSTAGITFQTGTYSVNAGATFARNSSGALNFAGGSMTYNGGNLSYTLSSAVTMGDEWPASTTPAKVTINLSGASPANQFTMTGSRTLSGAASLVLTNGVILLGNHDLTLDATGSMSISSPGSARMIAINGTGQFKKTIPAGNTSTWTFPIGEITGTIEYSPVSMTFSANSEDRTLGFHVTDADPPATSAGHYLTRYWSFTDDAAGTYSYTSTYTYPSGDVVGTVADILPATYDGAAWTNLPSSATTTTTTLSVAALTETTGPINGRIFTGRTEADINYAWTGTNGSDWTDGANWSTNDGTYPNGISHNVAINALAPNMPVVAGTYAVKNLTLNHASASLSINSGNLTVGGTAAVTLGTLNIANNASLTLNKTMTVSGTVNAAANSTIAFTGGATLVILPNITYGNLALAGSSTEYEFSGATVTIAGNYTQADCIMYAQYDNPSARTVNIGGNMELSGSAIFAGAYFDAIEPGNLTVNVAGNLTQSGTSSIYLEDSAGSGTVVFQVKDYTVTSTIQYFIDFGDDPNTGNEFRVSGDMSVSGTTATYTGGSSPANGFIFNKAGEQTFSNTSSATNSYVNYTVKSGATLKMLSNLAMGIQSNPASAFTVENGGTLDADSFSITPTSSSSNPKFNLNAGATLKASKNINTVVSSNFSTAGTTMLAGANYELYGSSAFSNTFKSAAVNNVLISNTAGVTLAPVTVNGALTVTTTGVLDQGANVISFGASGSATINGTVKTANLSGLSGATATTFNSNNNPAITLAGTSTVEYNAASGTQTVTARPDYRHVVLSNGAAKGFAGNTAVKGNFAASGGAITFPATMTFDGTGAQNLAGANYRGVHFGGTGTKSFTGNASIASNSALSFEPGSTATIDFDGASDSHVFSLKSDVGGTARVDVVPGSITLSGQVSAERYVPAKRAWRALTAPVKGAAANSIYANWQNNGSVIAGTGVEIWGPAGTGMATGTSYSVLSYSTAGWGNVTNTQTSSLFDSTRNNAYLVFVTGAYGSGNIGNEVPAAATTLKAKGELITGDQIYTGITDTKHSLVANPYASPIDLNTILDANSTLLKKFWVWDPAVGGTGGYNSYDATLNAYTNNTGSYTDNNTVVQSGQAFFVRANPGQSGSFTITENNKVGNVSNVMFREQADPALLRVNLFKQQGNDWQGMDGAIAGFYDGASNDVDAADGRKFANASENISFRRSNTSISSEHRMPIVAQDTLFVRVWNTSQSSYKLRINTQDFDLPGDLEAILQDLHTGTETTLATDGTINEYEFAVSSDALSSGDRFRIVFQASALGVDPVTRQELKIFPNPVTEGTVHLDFGSLEQGDYRYELVNTIGQSVKAGQVRHNGSVQALDLGNTAAGVYILRLTHGSAIVKTSKLIIK